MGLDVLDAHARQMRLNGSKRQNICWRSWNHQRSIYNIQIQHQIWHRIWTDFFK